MFYIGLMSFSFSLWDYKDLIFPRKLRIGDCLQGGVLLHSHDLQNCLDETGFLYGQSQTTPSKPGSAEHVSKNDPGVQKAVKISTYAFNNKSNDIYLFKASSIDDAQKQVVKGIKYFLEVKISRTVCRKTDHPSLDNCDFQPHGKLHQTFRCHFEVWDIPWLSWMKATFFLCLP